MLRFQVSILGRVNEVLTSALSVSFETAVVRLSQLPRLFIELDGSFVWRGNKPDGSEWQVDGNLIDQGPALAYVELKGCCPEERFDELLAAVGWPEQCLEFQLPRSGIVLDEAAFRRLAATDAGAI
jgi:hypothetical protein